MKKDKIKKLYFQSWFSTSIFLIPVCWSAYIFYHLSTKHTWKWRSEWVQKKQSKKY